MNPATAQAFEGMMQAKQVSSCLVIQKERSELFRLETSKWTRWNWPAREQGRRRRGQVHQKDEGAGVMSVRMELQGRDREYKRVQDGTGSKERQTRARLTTEGAWEGGSCSR